MNVYLNESPALKHFKNVLGNANHLIITILVGLDAVETQDIIVSTDLHATWSPQNKKTSARRARRMLLDMVLGRAIDALDIYVNHSMCKPFWFQDELLQNEINSAGISIAKKIDAIFNYYKVLDKRLLALAHLLIIWRNNVTHSESKQSLSNADILIIENNSEWLKENFCGLDSNKLLVDFEASKPPTLKEVASLLTVVHKIVRAIELEQFKKLNKEKFLKELLWVKLNKELKPDTKEKKVKTKKLLQSIWGKDKKERKQAIINKLRNSGLAEQNKYDNYVCFEEKLIDKLFEMKIDDVYQWLKSEEIE